MFYTHKEGSMNYLISLVIFLVMATLIGGYAFFLVWALGGAGVPLGLVLFVSFLFVVLLLSLTVAFVARMREIKKEEQDDYRNY